MAGALTQDPRAQALKVLPKWLYVGIYGGMAVGGFVMLVTQAIVGMIYTTVGPGLSLFANSRPMKAMYGSAPYVFGLTWLVVLVRCIQRGRKWDAAPEHSPEATTVVQTILRWSLFVSTGSAILLITLAAVVFWAQRQMAGLD